MYTNKDFPREQECPKCGSKAILGYIADSKNDKPVYICRFCGTWSTISKEKK